MRFFLSGELDAEIADAYRVTRFEIESKLNAALGASSYGDALEEIGIIPMILSPQFAAGRKERRLVQRGSRAADYRLFIDFEAFRRGSSADRRRLLVQNIIASVEDIHRKLDRGFDGSGLAQDIRQLFSEDVK